MAATLGKQSAVLIAAVIFFFCGLPRAASAREWRGFGPIELRTQNPVYLLSLGMTPQRAEVISEGTIEARIDSAYSNIFDRGTSAAALLDLDMELWRLAPQVSYGLTDDLEVGIEVPLVHFSGGFLDGFIRRFHSALGFPDGGRSQVPDGRFSYRFDAAGATRFDFPSTAMKLGDIVLHLKHQLTGGNSDWPALAIFADIKLPTGSKERGIGSGAPDFGVGAALETSWKRLHGYCDVGYYALGGDDLIDPYMNGAMFSYLVAGELTLLPSWSLVIQLNGSTPLLQGAGFDEWDGVPLDLVVGFRGEEEKLLGGQNFIWQVGFSEDVTGKGPSVDFTVFLSLGIRLDVLGRSRPAGDWLALKPVKREW